MRPHHDRVRIEDAHASISTGVIAQTIHFVERLDVSQWLLVRHEATKAATGRVYGDGRVFAEGGILVAAFHQDSMAKAAAAPLDPKTSMSQLRAAAATRFLDSCGDQICAMRRRLHRGMSDAILAETITIAGHDGDEIEAYLARPLDSAGRRGGRHPPHARLRPRHQGDHAHVRGVRLNAACPNLFHRYAPGAKAADAAAAALEAGGVPDEQCVGDVAGAAAHLRALPNANGKVGVIGYCSGGRQAYLVACTLDVDAAVDCYGGRVVAAPEDLTPARPVAPIDLTPKLRCPLLGLFGAEDCNPSPEQVARIEDELRAHGKTYEFHTYEDAGHAFFSVDRPSYHLDAAKDGWKRIWRCFGRHLSDA